MTHCVAPYWAGLALEDRLRPAVLSTSLESAFRVGPARAADVYRDLTVLRQFLESGSCPVLFDVLWAPLFLAVLFLVHPLLGGIGVCSALFLFGLSYAGEVATGGPVARSGAASTRSLSRLAIVTNSVQVIRAMGMLGGAARLIYQAAQEARSEHDTAQRRTELIMLIAKPVRALTQVLIMGSAAWLVLEHNRNPAIIFATSLLFGRAIAPVEGTISGWKAFAAALAAYRRLSEELRGGNPEKCNEIPLERPEGRLTVNNVGVALPGSTNYLLKGISFSLAPGDCLGIIGPSGCGKSILGQILAGISAPTQVKAPEDGVITELRVHTLGGVVGAGAPLMDLVPAQDRLIVTARVRPEDIDVVHTGLKADVHLLPYNQRRVPRLEGRVMHVSADRLIDKRTDQPYYATKIRVEDPRVAQEGLHIIPGMPAQVFIKTGHGTVALYALRPLLDSFHNAFRED